MLLLGNLDRKKKVFLAKLSHPASDLKGAMHRASFFNSILVQLINVENPWKVVAYFSS